MLFYLGENSMLKKYRETQIGTEYWETEERHTVILNKKIDKQEQVHVDTSEINLEKMTVKELKDFAESQGIDIPKSITKRQLVIEKIVGTTVTENERNM